jgi:hypothetical protein
VAKQDPARRILPTRLVTLASLEEACRGARQLVVDSRAVVTPAARDSLRERGIELIRQADVLHRAAATGPPGDSGETLLLVDLTSATHGIGWSELVASLGVSCQRLTGRGLSDTFARLAEQLATTELQAAVATVEPAAAVCLANRHPSLRAVHGWDTRALQQAAGSIAPNVLVLDPSRSSRSECANLLRTFLAAPRQIRPDLRGGLQTR